MTANHIELMGGPLDGQHIFFDIGNKADVEIKINGFLYIRSEHDNRFFLYHHQITTTMTAQECYDTVIKARNDQEKAVKETVFSGIIKAVQSSLFYYDYQGKISQALWAELEAAGFKITTGVERNDTYTSISWDLS